MAVPPRRGEALAAHDGDDCAAGFRALWVGDQGRSRGSLGFAECPWRLTNFLFPCRLLTALARCCQKLTPAPRQLLPLLGEGRGEGESVLERAVQWLTARPPEASRPALTLAMLSRRDWLALTLALSPEERGGARGSPRKRLRCGVPRLVGCRPETLKPIVTPTSSSAPSRSESWKLPVGNRPSAV